MPHLNCLHCGERFYARPSRIKKGFGKYCSKTCSNTHNNPAKSLRVPKNIADKIVAAYLGGKSKREAAEMYGYSRGATYNILKRRGIPRRTPSEALKGREFTDEWKQKISDNHHDVSGKNNPMYGEPSPNPHGWGNRTYVPHLGCKVRSRWEAEIANTLRELGIKHEYEKRRIHLGDCSTLPDFYLPDHDLYLEVKGRVNKHFKKVLRLLPELRPDIVFLVIYEAEYNAIQKDPSVLRNLIASAS